VRVEGPVKTIFVLDDDPEQAELMAQALTGRGRRVRAFSDPIRALAALTLDGADLLVADLSMPWIDGKDVVTSARLRCPELHIIMVSGYPRGAEIAAEEGVPFFAKPIDLGQFRAAVDGALALETQPDAR
jgi:two-component system, NtrC family, C4-dicarboxylate transport response regulator DctD